MARLTPEQWAATYILLGRKIVNNQRFDSRGWSKIWAVVGGKFDHRYGPWFITSDLRNADTLVKLLEHIPKHFSGNSRQRMKNTNDWWEKFHAGDQRRQVRAETARVRRFRKKYMRPRDEFGRFTSRRTRGIQNER